MAGKRLFSKFVIIPLVLYACAVSAAEYTVVVQPDYAPERSQQVFQPLIEYLNNATGHTFNLITPRDFHACTQPRVPGTRGTIQQSNGATGNQLVGAMMD